MTVGGRCSDWSHGQRHIDHQSGTPDHRRCCRNPRAVRRAGGPVDVVHDRRRDPLHAGHTDPARRTRCRAGAAGRRPRRDQPGRRRVGCHVDGGVVGSPDPPDPRRGTSESPARPSPPAGTASSLPSWAASPRSSTSATDAASTPARSDSCSPSNTAAAPQKAATCPPHSPKPTTHSPGAKAAKPTATASGSAPPPPPSPRHPLRQHPPTLRQGQVSQKDIGRLSNYHPADVSRHGCPRGPEGSLLERQHRSRSQISHTPLHENVLNGTVSW